MDAESHIQQGYRLIESKDALSIQKGIQHFIAANKQTENGDPVKPLTIYYLAYSNLCLGNFEKAYKIALKAKHAIGESRKSSFISLDPWPGQVKIDELLMSLNKHFPNFKNEINLDNSIDENQF